MLALHFRGLPLIHNFGLFDNVNQDARGELLDESLFILIFGYYSRI